jgi:hypothetical protein
LEVKCRGRRDVRLALRPMPSSRAADASHDACALSRARGGGRPGSPNPEPAEMEKARAWRASGVDNGAMVEASATQGVRPATFHSAGPYDFIPCLASRLAPAGCIRFLRARLSIARFQQDSPCLQVPRGFRLIVSALRTPWPCWATIHKQEEIPARGCGELKADGKPSPALFAWLWRWRNNT